MEFFFLNIFDPRLVESKDTEPVAAEASRMCTHLCACPCRWHPAPTPKSAASASPASGVWGVAVRGVHRERGLGQKAEEVATEPQLPELSTVCASPAYTLPLEASLVCQFGLCRPPWYSFSSPKALGSTPQSWQAPWVGVLGAPRPLSAGGRVHSYSGRCGFLDSLGSWGSGLTFRGHTVHNSGEC